MYGLARKMLVFVHQLGVCFSVLGGVQARVEAVLCIIDLALQEGVLIAVFFFSGSMLFRAFSEVDLSEVFVNFGPFGMVPFVGMDVEGRLGDGAFKELGKNGISSEGVLVSSRIELIFTGILKPVVDLRLMCKETS